MRRDYGFVQDRLGPCEASASMLICYQDPGAEEREDLLELGISDHDVTSALDPDELGRYEAGAGHCSLILKTPRNYTEKDNYLFRVTSFGLFLFPDRIVMVAPFDERELLSHKTVARARSRNELVLRLLAATVSHFFGHLKVINMISDSLERKVNQSMENNYLLSLFAIGKSLIFILNGINSNTVVMERLKHAAEKLGFSQEERELLEDVMIENAQCNRQAEIYAHILTDLTDARANIVSNNLNILIKRLTIVSVVFMPLNVIAGIGGMSEFTAMTRALPLWLSYPLMGLLMLGVAAVTWQILKRMSGEGLTRRRRRG